MNRFQTKKSLCAIVFDAKNMNLRYLIHILPIANDGALNKLGHDCNDIKRK